MTGTWGGMAGLWERLACPRGQARGQLFVTQVLFSSPLEAGGGMGESQLRFNASFYSVPFENSLLPTLPPTQYPKILMPEK